MCTKSIPYAPVRNYTDLEADFDKELEDLYHETPSPDPTSLPTATAQPAGAFQLSPWNPNPVEGCNEGIYTLETPRPFLAEKATLFVYTATQTVATKYIDCLGCTEVVQVPGPELFGIGPVRILT